LIIGGQEAAFRWRQIIAARMQGQEEASMEKSNIVKEIGYRLLKFVVGLGVIWLKKIEDGRGQGK